MRDCPFCHLDNVDISNTIIHKSDNFNIIPSKGALCEGYLLIVPKFHILSMNELDNKQKDELFALIKKYREIFHSIYGKYPIFFEHGTSKDNQSTSSSSVTHAHIHIVNHNFNDQNLIINKLNMKKVSVEEFFLYRHQNYISYISPTEDYYITYKFPPISQQMRIFIADDLGLGNNFNWRIANFDDNIIKTISKLKLITK